MLHVHGAGGADRADLDSFREYCVRLETAVCRVGVCMHGRLRVHGIVVQPIMNKVGNSM